jgi:A1 cistron-splicing factor AAR2
VVARKWDPASESIEQPPGSRAAKRRKKPETTEVDVVSRDHLKSLDPELAPYPFDHLETWRSLTGFVDDRCLARVIGFDDRGDAYVNAVMPSSTDEKELARASERRTWGKRREEDVEMDRDPDKTGEADDDVLNFAEFDLKRSWREGATGEELSNESRDKTGLLLRVLQEQLEDGRLFLFVSPASVLRADEPGGGSDDRQLLAEVELAFVLFTFVHQFASLDCYKRFIPLLCRSPAALMPDARLQLITSFLSRVLTPQLRYLRPEFFVEDLPGLDTFLLDELECLRSGLREAGRSWRASDPEWRELTEAWAGLSRLVKERFEWQLAGLDTVSAKTTKGAKRVEYNLLKEDRGEDEEYVEEGEYAPVVVIDSETEL